MRNKLTSDHQGLQPHIPDLHFSILSLLYKTTSWNKRENQFVRAVYLRLMTLSSKHTTWNYQQNTRSFRGIIRKFRLRISNKQIFVAK